MYIGIDVGGTNLVAGLVDQEGTILHKSACPVNRSWSAEELVSQLPSCLSVPLRRAASLWRTWRAQAQASPVWWTMRRALW